MVMNDDWTWAGKEFQATEAATVKERQPMVDILFARMSS